MKHGAALVKALAVNISGSVQVKGLDAFNPARVFVHHNDPVYQGDSFPHVMGDKDDGLGKAVSETKEQLLHVFTGLCVQGGQTRLHAPLLALLKRHFMKP